MTTTIPADFDAKFQATLAVLSKEQIAALIAELARSTPHAITERMIVLAAAELAKK